MFITYLLQVEIQFLCRSLGVILLKLGLNTLLMTTSRLISKSTRKNGRGRHIRFNKNFLLRLKLDYPICLISNHGRYRVNRTPSLRIKNSKRCESTDYFWNMSGYANQISLSITFIHYLMKTRQN